MRTTAIVGILFAASFSTGCTIRLPETPPPYHPHGAAVPIVGRVRLGNNRAEGQSPTNGAATAARTCSVVTMPRAAIVSLQVDNLRQSESLADVLRVNNDRFPLPITLEQDPRGETPIATQDSPLFSVLLPKGGSLVCLEAGVRPSGDIDDFEVDGVTLYAEGIDPGDVQVNRGLNDGTPPPTYGPGKPYGAEQQPYSTPDSWSWHRRYPLRPYPTAYSWPWQRQ